ncbi:MAG TPA: GDP-mannose 4,6-dehydratase, partial [Prosthecobacter sp.]|nr:GDP-mannose 4,6-dehydratase [Prosthecobacter sp.]
TRGRSGEIYNIGGRNEQTNLNLVETICDAVDVLKPELGGDTRSLITFVVDRAGHDRRYGINAGKIERELDWSPKQSFKEGLEDTVRWYAENS